MSFVVSLDHMHDLKRLISITKTTDYGNLLNTETETIKRRPRTEDLPVLCFMGDLTFFEQVTVTSCSPLIKFNTISEKTLKSIDSINLEALHFRISAADEFTLFCFMSLSVQKCKFSQTTSDTIRSV